MHQHGRLLRWLDVSPIIQTSGRLSAEEAKAALGGSTMNMMRPGVALSEVRCVDFASITSAGSRSQTGHTDGPLKSPDFTAFAHTRPVSAAPLRIPCLLPPTPSTPGRLLLPPPPPRAALQPLCDRGGDRPVLGLLSGQLQQPLCRRRPSRFRPCRQPGTLRPPAVSGELSRGGRSGGSHRPASAASGAFGGGR